MLISLSDKFLGKMRALASDQRFHSAISNLLLSFREGKHVLWASRAVLKELREELPAQQGILKLVEKKALDSSVLLEKVCCYVEVQPQRAGPMERHEHQDRIRYGLPYGWFDDSLRIQPTLLIGEHARDTAVYKAAARGFLHSEQLGVNLSLEPRSGRGAGCADCLKENIGNRLVFCIVDSDRSWPGGQPRPGGTAEKAQAELPLDEPAEIFVLPCHELENLLPEKLLEETIDHHPGTAGHLKRPLSRFKSLGILGNLGEYAFLDYKAGLTRKQVFDVADADERAFMSDLALRLQAKIPNHTGTWCQTRCISPGRCECVIYEGWGVLDFVVKYLERVSNPAELARLFYKHEGTGQPAWREISLRVTSWGCAYSKVAT